MRNRTGSREDNMQTVKRLLAVMAVVVCVAVALFTVYMILSSDTLAAYAEQLYITSGAEQTAIREADGEVLLVRGKCLAFLSDPDAETAAVLLEHIASWDDPGSSWPPGERLSSLAGQAAQSVRNMVLLGLDGMLVEARRSYESTVSPLFNEMDAELGIMRDAQNVRTLELLGLASAVNGRINAFSALFAVAVIAVTVCTSIWAGSAIRRTSAAAYQRNTVFGLISGNVDEVFEIYSVHEGKMIYVSSNLERIFGVPAAEYMADENRLRGQLLPEELAGLEKFYYAPLADGPRHMEFHYRDPRSGETRMFHSVLYPVQDGGIAAPAERVMLTRDVTEEAEIRRALEEALSRAEAANIAKQEFLSNMSHEVRTPINAIIGMEALAMTSLDDPVRVRRYLKQIAASARHMLSLVNDVLDMSKIESERLELESSPINLEAMLSDLVMMVTARVEQKGQTLTVSMRRCGVRSVMGDELRLRQVLLNLLTNAVKYTPEGGSITLRVAQDAPEHGIVATDFSVADSGCGISPEDRDRVFRPFERAESARSQPGTGLGLSISQRLVEGMGGELLLKSAPGDGSTFSFTVPLPVGPSAAPGPDGTRGGRLLLVEDNEINMEIARELLQSAGYEVTEAVNGCEAVKAFAQAPPGTFAAVLMDIQMPVMDGFEAAACMRADPERLGSTPILALTANVFSTDHEGRDLFDDFVAKPINPEQMVAQIEAARAGRHGLPGSSDGQPDQTNAE